MSESTTHIVWRELGHRIGNDGLSVKLLWCPQTGGTAVEVRDERAGSSMMGSVPRAHALEAFQHPFRFLTT